MTVTELIEALQGYPPDAVIAIRNRGGNPIDAAEAKAIDGYFDGRGYVKAPTVVIA